MEKSRLLTGFLVIWVIGTVAVSYLLNGPQFSCWYNSDSAIHVLMANDFSWPKDLYYWRQDRLGSAVPMVGYWIHLIGIPTGVSVGITKYFFLLLGFVLASRYLATTFSKLALALAWFFPLPSFHFWTSLGHPYAEHLALILATLALIHFSFSGKGKKGGGHYLALFLAPLFFMLAIWVSDLTIAFIPAFVFTVGFSWRQNELSIGQLNIKEAVSLLVGLGIGGWFLFHAKRAAFRIDEYHELLARPDQMIDMAQMLTSSWWTFLTFSGGNPFQSVAVWGIIITLLIIVVGKRKRRIDSVSAFWLAAVCSFAVVFVSYWANTPDPAHRHYTGIVPLVWIIVLKEIEHFEGFVRKPLMVISMVTVFATVGSGYWFHVKHKKGERPYQTALEVRKLGQAKLIGNYWNSYVLAAASPDSVLATAAYGHTVRNFTQAEEIVASPEVFLIKDNWLESFPDSIVQFDRLLIRTGNPFVIAEREMCKYRTTDIVKSQN